MAEPKADGRTRAEWRALLVGQDLSPAEIDEILSISFGDVLGDRIDLGEHPTSDDWS